MRRDVADVALADHVFAPHYALPLDHGCREPRVTMRAAPGSDAAAVSELLLGERFAVVDAGGDWMWGFSRHDHYVGYVPAAALGAVIEPTHRVTALAALLFAAADIKSPVRARLPIGAQLAGVEEGDFLRVDQGFVHRRHVAPIDRVETDPVAVALRLVGTPYRWGGRSGDGIDCSGLVQLAFAACGQAVPRDSDQQRAAIGRALEADEPAARGDLIFFPGHVGLMADPDHMVHANAHWMATLCEPLADICARLPAGASIIARRRPTW
ncbi:C40 family peptidase [Sphingomonas morindae]|uniref:C40 family peptidase n=1 Tax=Sphingomonas morindae TaxID=1541170 RepID=A0ABY4X5E6_9SPHN|nr:C40 family peptidase [Sphingomonas morindae]USI72099.1 C40 family peptidase [Sphingomonas morindae]